MNKLAYKQIDLLKAIKFKREELIVVQNQLGRLYLQLMNTGYPIDDIDTSDTELTESYMKYPTIDTIIERITNE